MSKPEAVAKKPVWSALAKLPVQVTLAVLGTFLLSWPIIQIAGERGASSFFQYVMLVWLLLIALLVLIGRSIAGQRALSDQPVPGDKPVRAEDAS